MWCIGVLTQEYRERMYSLLELYARPMSKTEPVICIDEKSLQLIGHSRAPLPMTAASPTKQDYEYVRNGTTNLFVAVEPKGGKRIVSVTERRGKIDFVAFITGLLTGAYAKARRIHLVLDNLNTHSRKCFDDVLGMRAAKKLLRRVEFHYTPKHASWLNMAEIEIGMALLHGSSCGRGYPNPTVVYATTTEVRTEFGRPALSMRLSTATATAASVH